MTAEVYKTLVAGPPNTGKTSLVKAYLGEKFQSTYTATVGVMMNVAQLDFPEGRVILSLVDLGGQESFRSLGSRFYQGSHHMILVYDITSRDTFKGVVDWYQALTNGVCLPSDHPLGGSLVGNKVDLEEQREIASVDGKNMANMLSLDFFETSAQTGQGVAEVFLNAASSSRTRTKTLLADRFGY